MTDDDLTDCFAGGSVEDTSTALLVSDLREFLSRAPDRECHITCRSGLWRVLLWVGADYYEGRDEHSLEEAMRGSLRQATGGQ